MLETKVGTVAIGRNEGDRLRRCVLSVSRRVPLVYVDSASTDESVSFARQEGAEIVELDLSRPFTAARARNEGLSRLLQKWPGLVYVQFVDGDCELENDWLKRASSFLEDNPAVAVVCGRRRERFKNVSFYNAWMDEEWDTPIGSAPACGGDALMRIGAIDEIGGYDDSLVAGEEPELCARLRSRGWTICRIDAPMTIHDADMHHFQQWWLRAVRSGYGYAQVFNKTRRTSGGTLYGRELVRAFAWTLGVVALALLLAFAIGPLGLLFAPITWVLQLVRLSFAHGARKGMHLLVGKAAEAIGAVRYASAAIGKAENRAIFYK